MQIRWNNKRNGGKIDEQVSEGRIDPFSESELYQPNILIGEESVDMRDGQNFLQAILAVINTFDLLPQTMFQKVFI